MSKFDELKKLAQQATTGPWEFDRAYTPISIQGGEVVGDDELPWGDVSTKDEFEFLDDDGEPATGPLIICEEIGLANGRFIAAANPAVILELLATQAQLVAALKAAKTWHNGEKWRDSSDPSEVRAWEQHRDIIADALAAAGAQP